MTNTRKIFISLFIMFLLTMPSIGFSASASDNTFMVSPVKLEFKAKPGETVIKKVKVANQGNKPIVITTEQADYFINPDNSFVFYKPGDKSYSSAKWVSLKENDFTLNPKEIKEIDIKLAIPTGVEPGGHYSCVFFKTGGDKNKATGVSVFGRIGVLILTSIGDEKDILRDGEITDFSLKNKGFQSDTSSKITFRNKGNVHLSLKGKIDITDIFGKKVDSLPLQSITTLPQTNRILTANWKGPWIGRFTAKPEIKYGTDLFTFDISKTAPAITFWIIPWKTILAVILFITVLFVAVKIYINRERKFTETSE